jgi:effector-binding domain-containing protein
MPVQVEVRRVAAQPIAVAKGMATAARLPERIRTLFDEFYGNFQGKGGLNVVFYPGWDATGAFDIECGVLAESRGNSAIPGGTVATATHMGPYDQMKAAHNAIHDWARENGRRLAGPSWEVYGHWSDGCVRIFSICWPNRGAAESHDGGRS